MFPLICICCLSGVILFIRIVLCNCFLWFVFYVYLCYCVYQIKLLCFCFLQFVFVVFRPNAVDSVPSSRGCWGSVDSHEVYQLVGLWCLTPLSTIFQLYHVGWCFLCCLYTVLWFCCTVFFDLFRFFVCLFA